MKKVVLIALAVLGVGAASSQARDGVVISFGGGGVSFGGGFYSRSYATPYIQHHAYHDEVAQEHGDLHQDLGSADRSFHRAARRDRSLRYEHGNFHRELNADHREVHHEARHDHDSFHGNDY